MGNRVEYYRKALDISQRELARRVGVSHTDINQIERKEREPGVYTALRIAATLNVSVEELFQEGKTWESSEK